VLTRGAGLADLGAAAATPASPDPASVGFGGWQGNRPVAASQQVTVRNVTGRPTTCTGRPPAAGLVDIVAAWGSLWWAPVRS
jgi:hypothetical protein